MNEVLVGLLLVLAAGYRLAAGWAPARRRRREARAVRRLLLAEIHDGRRSFDDPGVHDLLAWCAAAGREQAGRDGPGGTGGTGGTRAGRAGISGSG